MKKYFIVVHIYLFYYYRPLKSPILSLFALMKHEYPILLFSFSKLFFNKNFKISKFQNFKILKKVSKFQIIRYNFT